VLTTHTMATRAVRITDKDHIKEEKAEKISGGNT